MSTISASTTSTTAFKITTDTTGALVFQTGASPTTAMTLGSDQSVTFAGTPTYSGGTANGVAYLNASKVLTTGTALVFDGTNLGVGVTPSAWSSGTKALQVIRGSLWHDNGNYVSVNNNAYYDGTNWRYINSAYATNYNQVNGTHVWNTAGSGTAGNTISFTQAMTLTASNQLLIGTTSSAQALELVNNQNAVTRARITNTSTGSGAIAEWSSYNGSNQTTVAMYGTNTSSSGVLTPSTGYLFTDSSSLSLVVSGTSGVIKFGSGASFGEIARFTSAGNLVLAGGTTSANGIGVTFPASQSASTDANCLDDYEEGTWTPSYFGTSGNPTVSYGKQVGRYVKIGRMVYWGLSMVVSTTSGGSGTLYINGPFTSLSTGSNTWGGLVTWNGGGTFSGQQPSDFALINGTNNMYLHTRSITGASSDVPVSALSNGSNIEAFGMYEV